ncbi:hypothetical protein BGZ50_009051 [Haplosporangium sp. Z 11]|nr:hypothetical protein BGZ50_009051 [Haplosporangium sp. Z 11]
MSQRDKYIDPSEVIRKKDGRIDLFNTILARKDPGSQIPVLFEENFQQSLTSASLPPPRDLPSSLPQDSLSKQYPTTAPISGRPVASESLPLRENRKRMKSRSPSPMQGEASEKHVSKAVKADSSSSGARVRDMVEATESTASKPFSTTTTTAAPVEGGGRAFERIFIGYCARPETIPSELAYWHDENHVIIKDAYPKAKVHMLILPRQRINKVTDLSGNRGVKIVERLVERAQWLLERLKKESPKLEFKMGFHAIPSIL